VQRKEVPEDVGGNLSNHCPVVAYDVGFKELFGVWSEKKMTREGNRRNHLCRQGMIEQIITDSVTSKKRGFVQGFLGVIIKARERGLGVLGWVLIWGGLHRKKNKRKKQLAELTSWDGVRFSLTDEGGNRKFHRSSKTKPKTQWKSRGGTNRGEGPSRLCNKNQAAHAMY